MTYDNVNRPSHYTEGRRFETIEVIEDWDLDFCLGNAVKYISRAGRKDDVTQDLRKAIWYIERRISQLQTPEAQEIHPFTEELYGEILKAQPQDIGLDVDDSTLDYWTSAEYTAQDSTFPCDHPDYPRNVENSTFPCDKPGFVNIGGTTWDSDDSYMIEPQHSEYYYDVNRNRAYEDWT